jgi:hypothetical protein
MLAPVVQIDGAVYGHLARDMVPAMLRDFLASRADAGDPGPAGASANGVGQVAMCTCTSCRASGAGAVYETFSREAAARRLGIELRRSGCSGISYRAPVIELRGAAGESARYAGIVPADVPGILDRHFRARGPAAGARRAAGWFIDRFLGGIDRAGSLSLDLEAGPDAAFWAPQVRIATAESAADPLDLDGYLAEGGLSALRRCREARGPGATIGRVRGGGLRGRGGPPRPRRSGRTQPRQVAPRGDCNATKGDPPRHGLAVLSRTPTASSRVAIAASASGLTRHLLPGRYPLAIAAWQALNAAASEASWEPRDRGCAGRGSVRLRRRDRDDRGARR